MSKKPLTKFERDYPDTSNMPAFEMAARARELALIAAGSIMGFGAADYAALEAEQAAQDKARAAVVKKQPAPGLLGRMRLAAA